MKIYKNEISSRGIKLKRKWKTEKEKQRKRKGKSVNHTVSKARSLALDVHLGSLIWQVATKAVCVETREKSYQCEILE